MAVNTKFHPITIDLNEFKLHIVLKDRNELTLHFNSPSRKFYLTLIALVVNEMKKLGKITSIPVETHYDLLALLNNTIGEAAGSSDKGHLLLRIYRKWKDALPNLEEGPLFKVLGKKKEYEEGVARTYHFTEAVKDNWANLFEYKGSEENVRLKFAVDRIGAGLDDVVIIYEDAINGEAWERFISILREKAGAQPEQERIEEVHKEPVIQVPQPAKVAWSSRYRWAALIVAIVVVAGVATVFWKYYGYHAPQPETVFKEKVASLQYQRPLEVAPPSSKAPSRGKLIVDVAPIEKSEPSSPEKVSKIEPPVVQKPEVASKEKMVSPLPDKPSIAVQVKPGAKPSPSETIGGSKNPEVYLRSVEAFDQIDQFTRDGITRARRLFEEVIALEPDFSRGYSGLALSHGMGVMYGMSKSRKESLAQAISLAQKALSMNETDAVNHAALAYLLALTQQHDKAVVEAERALALDSNSFSVLNFSGLAFMYSCRGKEAVAALEKADRLNPSFRLSWLHLSWAYRFAGRYEEAFKQAQKGVNRSPNYLLAQLALTATCSLTGREAEARAAAVEVLRTTPQFSVDQYRKDLYALFRDKSQIDLTIDAIRKAGLK